MLNRSYYDDNFACELMEMYTALDTSIIEAMARRIARMGRVSDYTRWQAEILQEAGLLYEDIIRLIGEQTGMSDDYLQRVFEDAAVESVSFDNTIYEAAGLEIVPLRQSPSMMNLLRAGLKKTGGSLRNLTMTTANTAQTAYISACNLAYMQVSSGAMSYSEAIRAAVKASAKQGTKVLYPSGHQDQLDVAIRRSVLTGVSQTSAVIGMENARLMGCDLMEITAHAGARPEHAAWQGKIVSLSGRKGYLTLADIGYGSVTGFKGANCRHDWYPFFEGISTRLYSDRQLEELAKSDLYDLQQGQRAMERQIRATRRELAGYDAAMSAADTDTAAAIRKDFDVAAVKLKKQEAALREYCRSNGLLEDGSRVQTLYGDGTTQGFGRSTSQKAVWANRKALQNGAGSGIINIKIDQFSPCLINAKTGEVIDTTFSRVRSSELTSLKKSGWRFNWSHPDLRNSEIYQLLAKGDKRIQGLIALECKPENLGVHVSIVESAPHNKGKSKEFIGVGGHLFAIAAQKSVDNGFNGFLYFEAKNMDLVKHYSESLGAILFGRPHPYSMIIDESAAQKLLALYSLEEG